MATPLAKRTILEPKDIARHLTSRLPTGRIIWQSDFAKRLEFGDVALHSGYGNLSRTCIHGVPCMIIYNHTPGACIGAVFFGRIPTGQRRIGVEYYFGSYYEMRTFTLLDCSLIWEDQATTDRYVGTARISNPWGTNRALQYMDSAGNFQTITTGAEKVDVAYISDRRRGVAWNYNKLVIDFDTKKYVKWIYNCYEFDLSGYDIQKTTTTERLDFHLSIAYTALGRILPIRDVIITCDEP